LANFKEGRPSELVEAWGGLRMTFLPNRYKYSEKNGLFPDRYSNKSVLTQFHN